MATFQHMFLNEDRTGGGVHKVLSRGRNIWSESPEYKELRVEKEEEVVC